MAHLIDQTTGRAACFTAGEAPWHKLGQNVAECQTSAEAIKLACLDWRVDLRPVAATLADGTLVDCLDNFATVRNDTNAVLGVVGSSYRPLQNSEAFDFMDGLVGERLAMFETAGAIKGGRQVWVMARLPKEYQIARGDTVCPYALLTSSHDGTSAIRILPTTVRVVCNNTLTLALRQGNGQGLSIIHTHGLKGRLEDARRKLGIVCQRLDEFGEQATALTRRKMNPAELGEYFANLIADRSDKQQKELLERFACNLENSRNTVGGIGGSAWAAYNAVSEWADHEMRVMGATQADRLNNRLQSIWFGTAARLKAAAWESALALTA
jgi:phage/plasmid-like protein (TIGR03299 family)